MNCAEHDRLKADVELLTQRFVSAESDTKNAQSSEDIQKKKAIEENALQQLNSARDRWMSHMENHQCTGGSSGL